MSSLRVWFVVASSDAGGQGSQMVGRWGDGFPHGRQGVEETVPLFVGERAHHRAYRLGAWGYLGEDGGGRRDRG